MLFCCIADPCVLRGCFKISPQFCKREFPSPREVLPFCLEFPKQELASMWFGAWSGILCICCTCGLSTGSVSTGFKIWFVCFFFFYIADETGTTGRTYCCDLAPVSKQETHSSLFPTVGKENQKFKRKHVDWDSLTGKAKASCTSKTNQRINSLLHISRQMFSHLQ